MTLRQVEAEAPIAAVCRKMQVAESTLFRWAARSLPFSRGAPPQAVKRRMGTQPQRWRGLDRIWPLPASLPWPPGAGTEVLSFVLRTLLIEPAWSDLRNPGWSRGGSPWRLGGTGHARARTRRARSSHWYWM
jgi:hypothetical protein